MRNQLKSFFWHFVLTGIMFVLIGVAILYYPQIIVYLVSTLFIVLGVIYLSIANKIKHVEKNLEKLLKPFHE